MSDFMKNALWPYYALSLVLFAAILAWGLTGLQGGGGITFRLFGFYALIPAVTGIFGIVLGLKNARIKWLYPFFAGILAHLLYQLFFRHAFTILPWGAYVLLPFSSALFGLSMGMFIGRLEARHRVRLKQAWKILWTAGLLIALIHGVHALTLDRMVEYTEVSFSSPRVSPALSGYRIAFIVDTHSISEERLWEIVAELNQGDLDLLLLGGDMSSRRAEMEQTVRILSQVETRDGIFGVEGNHDWHPSLFAAMEAHGMTPLSNSGLLIREHFFLAGVEDLWNRTPDISAAIEGAETEDFVLLLSHNPDVSMQQNTTGVDLILSGHTHGGQIVFFGIWAPYFTFGSTITDYGQRFRSGWALSHDETPVFVSRGTGEYFARVFSRPQVALITLLHEPKDDLLREGP